MTALVPNKFGLSLRDLESIHSILNKYSNIRTVVLFGSRAKGNFKSGSDIDLAIMNSDIPEETLIKIQNDFKESDLPYFVDLVNFQSLQHNELKDHISRVGVLFYQKK
jgi:predicted nucleotidyltransferase